MKVNFLGLGVEKAATSWLYACMYEHPELCLPYKEINFFSKEEKWLKGLTWYEKNYKDRCLEKGVLAGEFSTEYFYTESAAERIAKSYPDVKLIVSLRDPVYRAYSQYYNSIKAGALDKSKRFLDVLQKDSSYIAQGHYKEQFDRYFKYFSQKKMHVIIYEDLAKDPKSCIQSLYKFLGVNDQFIPSNVDKIINPARIPKNQTIDSAINKISDKLQETKIGDRIWWVVKNSGIPKLLRSVNTEQEKTKLSKDVYKKLSKQFEKDKLFVEDLLQRNLSWSFEEEV